MSAVHTCHAIGCRAPVPPRLFMCYPHWRALPVAYKRAVLAHYRPGQEITKTPSAAYLRAAQAARVALARRAGVPVPAHDLATLDRLGGDPVRPEPAALQPALL